MLCLYEFLLLLLVVVVVSLYPDEKLNQARLGEIELTLRIHYRQAADKTGNGTSTLVLKPMSRVNRNLKWTATMAPQNGAKNLKISFTVDINSGRV